MQSLEDCSSHFENRHTATCDHPHRIMNTRRDATGWLYLELGLRFKRLGRSAASHAVLPAINGVMIWRLNEVVRSRPARDRQIGSRARFGLIRCSMRPRRAA